VIVRRDNMNNVAHIFFLAFLLNMSVGFAMNLDSQSDDDEIMAYLREMKDKELDSQLGNSNKLLKKALKYNRQTEYNFLLQFALTLVNVKSKKISGIIDNYLAYKYDQAENLNFKTFIEQYDNDDRKNVMNYVTTRPKKDPPSKSFSTEASAKMKKGSSVISKLEESNKSGSGVGVVYKQPARNKIEESEVKVSLAMKPKKACTDDFTLPRMPFEDTAEKVEDVKKIEAPEKEIIKSDEMLCKEALERFINLAYTNLMKPAPKISTQKTNTQKPKFCVIF